MVHEGSNGVGHGRLEDRRKFTEGLPEVETFTKTSQGNLSTAKFPKIYTHV